MLAVNTAGMLVRLDVLRALGGFDRALPVFGNDLDFGWRAASAGYRTIIVPQAVVFHAEAAHRGTRRTSLTGRHTHYQERRGALYTLLANSRARSLPFRLVRLTLGTVVRVLGYLLVRSVGEALDELAALLSVYSRPRQLLAARRARRALTTADPATVRGLLAPWWVPYRHGLDFVSDLAAAATNQAQDVAERRRAAALEQAAADAAAAPSHSAAGSPAPVRHPVATDDDDDELEPDSGLLTRFLTSPVALGIALFVVAVLVGTRQAWGSVSGGALAPAPAVAADWWRLYVEHWHALALGTDAPAPAYLLPLASLASVLGGSPGAAVGAVLVLAVPLALWGAWRLVRVVGRFLTPAGMPRWLVAGAAATYGLVPVVSGAWGGGRLGLVAAATLLPWLAHAALGFGDPERERRWRAAWRTGLLLAMTTAFAPVMFPFFVLLTLLVLGLGVALSRSLVADRSVSGPPLVALAVVPLLLLPWWLPMLLAGRPGGLLLDPGRLPVAVVGFGDLLLGRVDDVGAPAWLTWPVIAAAVLALLPRTSRVAALACWTTALVAAVDRRSGQPPHRRPGRGCGPGRRGRDDPRHPGHPDRRRRGGRPGAAPDARHRRVTVASSARRPPGRGRHRRPGRGRRLVRGGRPRRPGADETSDIPAYMSQSSQLGPEHGVLVVRGDVETGLDYAIRRGDGDTLGEDEILALTPEDEAFSDALRALVSRPTPEVIADLSARGIEYVVLPAPADGRLAAQLDAAVGLSQASAEDRATRAWRIDQEPAAGALDGPGSWLRTVLLVVQGLAILVVAVLCGPSWRERRR